MSEEFLERPDRLDQAASAAPQGLLVHRAYLVRPGPLAGRVTPVRLAPQAPPVSAAPLEVPVPSARLDRQAVQAQQEARARLARRD